MNHICIMFNPIQSVKRFRVINHRYLNLNYLFFGIHDPIEANSFQEKEDQATMLSYLLP